MENSSPIAKCNFSVVVTSVTDAVGPSQTKNFKTHGFVEVSSTEDETLWFALRLAAIELATQHDASYVDHTTIRPELVSSTPHLAESEAPTTIDTLSATTLP